MSEINPEEWADIFLGLIALIVLLAIAGAAVGGCALIWGHL